MRKSGSRAVWGTEGTWVRGLARKGKIKIGRLGSQKGFLERGAGGYSKGVGVVRKQTGKDCI